MKMCLCAYSTSVVFNPRPDASFTPRDPFSVGLAGQEPEFPAL